VGIEGVPLDSGALGDLGDRRPRRAQGAVQLDGHLDDALARLLALFLALTEPVRPPIGCT
jgi:hypothetical protein